MYLIYRTGRIQLTSRKSRAIKTRIMESFAIDNEIVDGMAREVIARLGGRKRYASVHCRVGDGTFADDEEGLMRGVFDQLATKVNSSYPPLPMLLTA